MRRLVLVRHSVPELRRDVPAAEWQLSPDGIDRARRLARQLDPAPVVFASTERKAVETARAMAEVWGAAVETVAGLHEHERPQAQC